MDREKEVWKKLIKYPSTYMALHIMRGYLSFNNNLIVKDGKKYKCKDLADDMDISRQMASIHIKRLQDMNLIAEVPTNRGMFWAMNPDYYRRGDELPQVVINAFEKKIKVEDSE